MSANKQEFNPFTTLLYLGDEYYCPRENDEKQLIDAWKNGRGDGETIFEKKVTK